MKKIKIGDNVTFVGDVTIYKPFTYNKKYKIVKIDKMEIETRYYLHDDENTERFFTEIWSNVGKFFLTDKELRKEKLKKINEKKL